MYKAAIGQTQEAQSFAKKRCRSRWKPIWSGFESLRRSAPRSKRRFSGTRKSWARKSALALSEDYERLTSDLQYRTETYQKAVNRRRNELFQKMGPRRQAALDDLVKLEAYDLVLPRNTVIYVNPKHDITRKVTEVLDKQT